MTDSAASLPMGQNSAAATAAIPFKLILTVGLINAPLMNITQGAVPAKEQSEISGLSRAMSNLGGAFGTAVAGAVLMSTLIATFSGAVEQYTGIPASEKARVVLDLRRDAQTVSNAQVTAYLKGKNEPAAVAQKFVQFNQDARNEGLRNALIAVGLLGILGFAASCFLPGGKTKKPAVEPAEIAPLATAPAATSPPAAA
jgi:hypothetical protein